MELEAVERLRKIRDMEEEILIKEDEIAREAAQRVETIRVLED